MKFEHRIEKIIDEEKAWACLSDPKTWTKWDPTLIKLELDAFTVNARGIKYMKKAHHPLPFEVVQIDEGKKIVIYFERGKMSVYQEYCIEDRHLVFRVDLNGREGKQTEIMYEKITKLIPMMMNRFVMMIQPIMPSRKEALSMFFKEWTPSIEIENVSIKDSLRRTLACDLYSQVTLPLYRVSMMDGIAVKSSAFQNGKPDTSHWIEGIDYVRADTGDDFPDDYDAIIMIEDVEWKENGELVLHNKRPVEAGMFTRPAGSTIKEGELLLKKGTVLRPTDLAVIAMGNHREVPVIKKPVVAFIPTGSELVKAGSQIHRGENIDTNSYLVQGQLQEMGAKVITFPIIKDNKKELEKVLNEALSQADIVIINGGSSKGGEDFNIQLLEEKGHMICHNVAAVPGRPIALSLFDNKPVINIPGPCLAAYFATGWCIQAILDCWFLNRQRISHTVKAKLTKEMDNGGPVQILNRMDVYKNEEGRYEAIPYGMKDGQVKIMASNGQYVSSLFEEAHQIGDELEIEIID